MASSKFVHRKSKGISEKSPRGSNNTYAPRLIYYYPLPHVKFARNRLRLSSIFSHKNVVNLYISYTQDTWSRDLNTDFTLSNCLFGAVKLTKNFDPDKYGYTCYGIGFDAHSQF